MTSEAADFVGDIAHYYDHGLGPVIFADYASDIANRVATLAPMRVLETAAGTGIVTRQLRNRLAGSARLTATDFNLATLDIARSKFRPDEQVELRTADATALPFDDQSFDALVCQFGVMFFPDKDKSYREAHRILARGGRYFFNVWGSLESNPFGRIAHETVSSFFDRDPPQFYMVPFGYHQIGPIKKSLMAAGFSAVSSEVVEIEKDLRDQSSFAEALVYGNPLINQIRERSVVDPKDVVAALVRALEGEFGSGPVRMPLHAVVFEALKE